MKSKVPNSFLAFGLIDFSAVSCLNRRSASRHFSAKIWKSLRAYLALLVSFVHFRPNKQNSLNKEMSDYIVDITAKIDNKIQGMSNLTTSHENFTQWVHDTSDVIVVLNKQFTICSLNPAAETALGRSSQEANGRRCQEILGCQNLSHVKLCGTLNCPLRRVLENKKPLSEHELIIGTEPSHQHEFSTSITPTITSKEVSVVFAAREMSALRVASRVRANFTSMVSHELRTPLNSVHGFIDLLLQGHMGELMEEQQTYLGYAQEGVQQLVSIVEDILFMTRLDSGQFEIKLQEVYLQSLVRQVFRSLHNQAAKAKVILALDIPADVPLLNADPQRMKQVLSNLVTNAIKFTPPDGTVTVRVRQHTEDLAMISVADTGYGIHPEDRPHIFERFYQSNHREQSKMGGYGLGLSIAKLIVEQHGGTINFDTDSNKGTTFYFTIPLYPIDKKCTQ